MNKTLVMPIKTERFAIGIDPGKETGVAVYDRKEKKLMSYFSSDFWNVWGFLNGGGFQDDCFFVIENPGLHKRPIYRFRDVMKEAAKRERMAMNIGANRREATLLIEGLERKGFTVRQIKPTSEKWTAEQLKRYTGISKKTNQHVRDAIKLVWQI